MPARILILVCHITSLRTTRAILFRLQYTNNHRNYRKNFVLYNIVSKDLTYLKITLKSYKQKFILTLKSKNSKHSLLWLNSRELMWSVLFTQIQTQRLNFVYTNSLNKINMPHSISFAQFSLIKIETITLIIVTNLIWALCIHTHRV